MGADIAHYEQFEPSERLTLVPEAMARGDDAEASRLGSSCPRGTYTACDSAFGDRMDLAFDTMAVVCIDLRALWCKLDVLHWALGLTRELATHHQITATFAFMDGERLDRKLPQLDFFGKPRADESEGEEVDDGVEPEENDPPPEKEPPRFSAYHEGELARRMMAVEDRMQGMSDFVFATLLRSCAEIACELASTWEAFGRFTRSRIGVAPETMLDAWEFPITAGLQEMLNRYEQVKPDPAKVEQYLSLISGTWDRKFGVDE